MNLWADFEHEHQDVSSASVSRRQARRLTDQAIVSCVREWLLQDYAALYGRALAAMRIYRRCFWVDGWGPGSRDGQAVSHSEGTRGKEGQRGERKPTSLQAVMALSEKLASEHRPITLQGVVLEAGSSRRKEGRERRVAKQGKSMEGEAALQDGKSRLRLPKESGVVKGSWLEVGTTLLAEIGPSPAIFLLNPFGQTLFGYDDLAPLFQRTSAPTELLLLVPHKQVEIRLQAAMQGASGLTTLLRTDRWKALLPQEGELQVAQGIEGVLNLLVSAVQPHFLWTQKIALPVQLRPAVVETAPYTLLFATRSKDSLLSMNDAVCIYRRQLVVQSRQGVLGEEWFAAQEEVQLHEEKQGLYGHLLQVGKGQRVRRWPELRQQLLLAHFGRFTVREYDEGIQKMLRDGEVRCEWRHRAGNEEEMAVPGNEDTLLWR